MDTNNNDFWLPTTPWEIIIRMLYPTIFLICILCEIILYRIKSNEILINKIDETMHV